MMYIRIHYSARDLGSGIERARLQTLFLYADRSASLWFCEMTVKVVAIAFLTTLLHSTIQMEAVGNGMYDFYCKVWYYQLCNVAKLCRTALLALVGLFLEADIWCHCCGSGWEDLTSWTACLELPL